ncbi:MAG TPA: HAMP domain-containing sensor histidine kinase [Polyangia bacterium]|nr:HAMP domain-containing sensor histidine kinase [Polyangia bacterium]
MSFEHRRFTHELEIHQLELEVQNRALRENQELLEESRARYAELYEHAPIGHVTLDAKGLIREINLVGAALFGKAPQVLRALPMRPLLAVPSRRAFDAHLRACFTHGHASVVELVILTRAETRSIELVSAPRPAVDGEASTESAVVHSVMHDISDHKRNDAQREEDLRREREARVLAETANRIKEDFLAIVSHELRTPLAPMMMWVQALRAGGAGDALRARAVEAIDTCLKVQVAMIDDLVDVARGQHGQLRIARRPMDLQKSVGAAIEALAPSGAAKHVAIALEVDAEPAWVSGDATRLQQVVANLLSNAIKFTPEGGHVVVSVRSVGASVHLRVRDDGEGIPVGRLEHIFEPFRRYDSAQTRGHGGLGLGLSIVEQLIAQHDGKVVAESAGRGRGTCFVVTLPRLADGTRATGAAERI